MSLEKELKSSIDEKKSGIKFQVKTNKPNSALKLINPDHDRYPIVISRALADLMEIPLPKLPDTPHTIRCVNTCQKARQPVCLLHSLRSH